MKNATSNRARLKAASVVGNVVVGTGEAVLGPIAEMFPRIPPLPGDTGQPWLYFSVPKSTFDVLCWAGKHRTMEAAVEIGAGKFAGEVSVRIRVLNHCVLVHIPVLPPFDLAMETLARDGCVRVLVACQVSKSPLTFQMDWQTGPRSFDEVALSRDCTNLRVESNVVGVDSYLTACEVETPDGWKKRTSQEVG